MPTPLPTQLSGALFLASHKAAILEDEPRVGKTGAACIAADYILAHNILVITTASGRSVWRRDLPAWSTFPRRVQVLAEGRRLDPTCNCVVVSWNAITNPRVFAELLKREWDLLISDEDHYAKNFEAKRTQALYGTLVDDGRLLDNKKALYARAKAVWPLTGTPLPNSPFDDYPRLRALAPDRLRADPAKGWPDVTRQSDFKKRYCITRPMKIGRGCYSRAIDVIVSGKNEAELNARRRGFALRRTQKDVGIREPVYETFPLAVSERVAREIDSNVDAKAVLEAAEANDTKALEMHLGPIRRLTGEIKARAMVEVLKEEFDCGLDKVVLMRWHTEAGRILRDGLAKYGVVSLDGSTSLRERQIAEDQFRDDPKTRVFDGQIQAAGEAIDLSASSLLFFVETSIIPKDMKQAALRITNHAQTRLAIVRVAALEGSIDEALQTILLRKWSSIREVLAP